MIDLDLAKDLLTSGFTLDDLAIYFDFDSTEELRISIESRLLNPWRIWVANQIPSRLTPQEVANHRGTVELKRNDPERLERQLIQKIIGWAQSMGTSKDIVLATGMSVAELNVLIKKRNLNKNFKKFIARYHAEARLTLRNKQFENAINGSEKLQVFLGEKVLSDQKEVPKDTNININTDNRKVIVLPAKVPLKEILEQQKLNEK